MVKNDVVNSRKYTVKGRLKKTQKRRHRIRDGKERKKWKERARKTREKDNEEGGGRRKKM